MNVEVKCYDVASTGTTVSTTTVIQSLTSVIQGDDDENRDGTTGKMCSLDFRYIINRHVDNTNPYSRLRIIIFRDGNNNNPGTTDPTHFGAPYGLLKSSDLVSGTRKEGWSRYNILYDKIHVIGDSGCDRESTHEYRYYQKWQSKRDGVGGLKIVWDNENTEPASKSNLWLMMWSEDATNAPVVKYFSRMRFIDN